MQLRPSKPVNDRAKHEIESESMAGLGFGQTTVKTYYVIASGSGAVW